MLKDLIYSCRNLSKLYGLSYLLREGTPSPRPAVPSVNATASVPLAGGDSDQCATVDIDVRSAWSDPVQLNVKGKPNSDKSKQIHDKATQGTDAEII